VIQFLKYIFYLSILFLIVFSLYPGSLIGYWLYGDMSKELYLVENLIGTSINHFAYYLYVSLLGFYLHIKTEKFKIVVLGILSLSIILEILQIIIPIRAFELIDLLANVLGVLFAYFIVKIYLFFDNNEQV
jgi:VanZ family protein